MSLNVSFKLSGAASNSFSLDLAPSLTVLILKGLLKEHTTLDPNQMKLIFKGRILKDDDTLESNKVESGQTMHIVRSAASPSTANAPTTVTPTTSGVVASTGQPDTISANPMAAMMQDPAMMQAMMGGMGGTGGMGAGGGNPMAAMMQDPAMMQAAMQMMGGMGGTGGMTNPGLGGMGAEGGNPMAAMMGGNPMGGANPAMMGQLMQNPMMQQMLQNVMQNPAMLQQMIQSNPMLQQMTQSNPMMAQMMSDPQFLQMSMQMMSNPQMMQALGGMQGVPGANPSPALMGGVTPSAPVAGTGGTNPMASMMQDPAMMQAMMQMMGGTGGAGMQGGTAEAMGGFSPQPSRCACGNFQSGTGDGLCNACRRGARAP